MNAQAGHGSAATVLAEVATRAEAGLLVVGHRGRGGFPGLGLGSTALRIVSRSSVPALVVRGDRHLHRGTVLAAVDITDTGSGSDATGGADAILGFAFAEAERRRAELKAITAWEILWPPTYFGDTGQLQTASDEARERADAALAHHKLSDGDPTTILVAASTYADLIVSGARRRARGGVHLGPVVHTLLRHADCPVAVVPCD